MSVVRRGRPFEPGRSGNPGGRPRVASELRELARLHAPDAIKELARLALKAKSETARVTAIRELLDRGCGKSAQFLAAANEIIPDGTNNNTEELRAQVLADFAAAFPELEIVPKKRLTLVAQRDDTL